MSEEERFDEINRIIENLDKAVPVKETEEEKCQRFRSFISRWIFNRPLGGSPDDEETYQKNDEVWNEIIEYIKTTNKKGLFHGKIYRVHKRIKLITEDSPEYEFKCKEALEVNKKYANQVAIFDNHYCSWTANPDWFQQDRQKLSQKVGLSTSNIIIAQIPETVDIAVSLESWESEVVAPMSKKFVARTMPFSEWEKLRNEGRNDNFK